MTTRVYRFSTFQELVDRVPGDRIRDCMEELGTVLGSAKLTAELVEGVARNLAEADGKKVPPREGNSVIKVPAEFEWHDDGKRELEARLHDANGERLLAVKITRTDQCVVTRQGGPISSPPMSNTPTNHETI